MHRIKSVRSLTSEDRKPLKTGQIQSEWKELHSIELTLQRISDDRPLLKTTSEVLNSIKDCRSSEDSSSLKSLYTVTFKDQKPPKKGHIQLE